MLYPFFLKSRKGENRQKRGIGREENGTFLRDLEARLARDGWVNPMGRRAAREYIRKNKPDKRRPEGHQSDDTCS